MRHEKLFQMITDFSNKHGSVKHNDSENLHDYMKLVDCCIECGLIPKCNREEFSTHGILLAAITYESDRYEFCDSME